MTSSKAGRRDWIGLAVLACPCILLSMDFTVLHLAVPAITAQLRPSSAQLLWIVDIYGFTIAASLITMGTLGDRIGRRKLLLIGAGLFGIASIAAAFSTSASMLIVTRALLGVAGATLMPSTLALIRNMFHDDHERRVAISIWINAYIVGGIIGPIAGGLMLAHFWWGSVFLLNVPVMASLLITGPRLLPEFKDPNAGRMDILSAAMSLVSLLAVIYGIKQLAQEGSVPVALAAIAGGILVGISFVIRQRGLEDPLIDLNLFRVPGFGASIGLQIAAATTSSGIYLFVVQYLQLVLGFTPFHAGLWLLPSTVAGIIGTTIAPYLASRARPTLVVVSGMIASAIGMLILTQIGKGPGVTVFVTAYVIISLGISLAMTLTTDLIMSAAPPERAGAASAISETSGELGLALGIALLGSLGTAFYRQRVAVAIPPGTPAESVQNAKATLGGAIGVSSQLDISALAVAAREAFTHSLQIVSGISALLVILVTVTTVLLLRRSPRLQRVSKPP